MAGYMEILAVREYKDKQGEPRSAWTKVGTAFPNKDGAGFSLKIDFLPADWSTTKLMMREPKPRDGGQQRGGRQQAEDYGD